MAKKKFTDGLETLFGESALEEKFEDRNPLLAEQKEVPKEKKKKTIKRKKKTGKSFTSDLDSLFKSSSYQKDEKRAPKAGKTSTPKAQTKIVFGLDALIRKTTNLVPGETYEASTKKRVTFIYDKKKLETLKLIARKNKAYMKDIIGAAVNNWISDYEKKHGKINPN